MELRPGLKPEEIKAPLADADGWVVRSATQATAALIEGAPRLRVIGRAGSGVDNVDVAAASRKGVIVMNVPGANTIAVAELAFAMLASLARHIPQATQSLREGRWEKKAFAGEELYGKTLGVVGFGRIGQAVAVRARAFEMKVLAYDPVLRVESVGPGTECVTLEALLERSDYITLHVPLTADTRGLLGESAFKRIKHGARLVQCSRGGVVDEAALLKALHSGRVGGAALDVFEKEPAGDSPLLQLPNVIATPHLGASTVEAQENVAVLIAEQMVDALLGRGIRNAVNLADLGLSQEG